MPHVFSAFSTKNKSKQFWLVFFVILGIFLMSVYASLRFGAVNYSHAELVQVLRHPLTQSPHQDVVMDIRLPRILAALLVGAALAQSGLIMQGVTRNPIADPGLLGIHSGAGLALIISYALFASLSYRLVLVICLLGSLVAALLVFGLSYRRNKGYDQLRLILSGAMVASLFQSIGQAVTIRFHLSTRIIGWQAGGFVEVNWKMLAVTAPLLLLAMLVAQLLTHQLTILSLNETVAKSLGQHTQTITYCLLGLVVSLSGLSVALAGTIAFVGLIIPHLIRMFVGRDYRFLLPLTAFAGATFLLWVDLVARTIHAPYEVPLQALISLIGLPCFLWLIRRGNQL